MLYTSECTYILLEGEDSSRCLVGLSGRDDQVRPVVSPSGTDDTLKALHGSKPGNPLDSQAVFRCASVAGSRIVHTWHRSDSYPGRTI
jgi:hypothetical protein